MPRRPLRFTTAMYRTDSGEQLRRFEEAQKRLRGIVGRLEDELDAIERDVWATDEERQARAHRARARAGAELEAVLAEGYEARERGAELVRTARARRHGSDVARERVRALLERVSPSELLERAWELDDDDTIQALSSELVWLGQRAEGEGAPEVAALIDQCDRALATLLPRDAADRAESMAAAAWGERGSEFDLLGELATKTIAGTPTAHTRLKLGHQASQKP